MNAKNFKKRNQNLLNQYLFPLVQISFTPLWFITILYLVIMYMIEHNMRHYLMLAVILCIIATTYLVFWAINGSSMIFLSLLQSKDFSKKNLKVLKRRAVIDFFSISTHFAVLKLCAYKLVYSLKDGSSWTVMEPNNFNEKFGKSKAKIYKYKSTYMQIMYSFLTFTSVVIILGFLGLYYSNRNYSYSLLSIILFLCGLFYFVPYYCLVKVSFYLYQDDKEK